MLVYQRVNVRNYYGYGTVMGLGVLSGEPFFRWNLHCAWGVSIVGRGYPHSWMAKKMEISTIISINRWFGGTPISRNLHLKDLISSFSTKINHATNFQLRWDSYFVLISVAWNLWPWLCGVWRNTDQSASASAVGLADVRREQHNIFRLVN